MLSRIAVAVLMLTASGATTAVADQMWTLTDSPIVISTDTTIQSGETVTVEPGVVVQLQQGAASETFQADFDVPPSGSTYFMISSVQRTTAAPAPGAQLYMHGRATVPEGAPRS